MFEANLLTPAESSREKKKKKKNQLVHKEQRWRRTKEDIKHPLATQSTDRHLLRTSNSTFMSQLLSTFLTILYSITENYPKKS